MFIVGFLEAQPVITSRAAASGTLYLIMVFILKPLLF
jgi:hypothetical protein